MPQREQKQAENANSDSFTSLTLGLTFDLNPDSIKHIWGNSTRGDCVDVLREMGECGGGGVKTSVQDAGLGCN